jgi:NADH:ubiquinone oxidoreductase subunit 5 (subunit L)/multisubunit Na+/H+ antiporter MnhA subunit
LFLALFSVLNRLKYLVKILISNKIFLYFAVVFTGILVLPLNIFFFYFLEIFVLFFAYLFINFLGVRGYFVINMLTSLLFATILVINFFNFNVFNEVILLNFGQFFKFSDSNVISLILNLDFLSYNFCLLTSLISSFVYFYAFSYMRNELGVVNFFFFLKFFVLSMILLLMAGN